MKNIEPRTNGMTVQQYKKEAMTLLILCHGNSETFENIRDYLGGLDDWYESYLLSPAFAKANDEIKAKSFDNYRSLKFIINHIVELNLEQL